MTPKNQSIVLCEGFHDRSFLKGWLLAMGCVDPSQDGKARISDPWGKPVTGGNFGFHDPNSRFLRVVPANADNRCFSIAEKLLGRRTTEEIRDMVIVVDSDDSEASRRAAFESMVTRMGGLTVSRNTGVLEDGTRLRLILLGEAIEGPGVPNLACLERTVCCAIGQAYPERADGVAKWMDAVARAHAPGDYAKAHSWTYMAGWFPAFGCDGFYQEVWRDPQIRENLVALLVASGGWATMEEVLADTVGPAQR